MRNEVRAWLYEAPAILLMAVVFIGGIYAGASGKYKFAGGNGAFITFIIIMLAVIVLFFFGKYYDNRKDFHFSG